MYLISILLTFCFFGLSLQDLNQSCPLYQCSKIDLTDDICSYTFTNTTVLKDGSNYSTTISYLDTMKCKAESKICPNYNKLGNVNCTDSKNDRNFVDGEPCTNSAQCYSGFCKDNKTCVGLENFAICKRTNDCKVGSYCTGKNKTDPLSICLPQLKENGTCKERLDCINSHDCVNSKCVPVFSLPDGYKYDNSMFPHLCKSGYAYSGLCTEYKFLGGENYVFNVSNKCSYNFTAMNINETFNSGECSLDGTFNKYCPKIGTEHKLFVDYKTRLKKWYNEDALNLHSVRRDDLPGDIRILQVQVVNWPKLINSDKCVISLFGKSSIQKLSLFVIFSLVIFLF